jgi:phospholipid-transporting ATPase
MSSDFERLVSSANPAAARAYQPSSGVARPPRASLDKNPFLIDDFDEDDDAITPDSRFHGPAQQASSSQAAYGSQRPNPAMNPLEDPIDAYGASNSLARGLSTTSKRSVHGSGQPEGWIFDADTPSNNPSTLMVNRNGSAFDGSKLFNGTINESSEGLRVGGQQRRKRSVFSFKKTWKWPWEKEKVLMGERIIFLNDEGANADSGFVSNYVSTSKYNMATFLPKFLYGMLSLHSEMLRR